MNINVMISLGPAESAAELPGNATALAVVILDALGGDPATDICSVSISDMGQAGATPTMPPAPQPVVAEAGPNISEPQEPDPDDEPK
jgi:hypothetical protein